MTQPKKKVWRVPITVVEYGRVVEVEAASKREAMQKARAAEWDNCSDADRCIVKVAGAATEVE